MVNIYAIRDGRKLCTQCNQTKSLTEYYKDSTIEGGYERKCKSCRKSKTYEETEPLFDEILQKCIGVCGESKPISAFKKDSQRENGRSLRCKNCLKNRGKKITGIYKITSPSGKVYIGESINITKRFSSYKSFRIDKQPRLIRSLRKHGWNNHKFEIIEECEISELKCRERYWQDFYDVIGENGLNCKLTACGEDKQIFTAETSIKISESLLKMRKSNPLGGNAVINTQTLEEYISVALCHRENVKDCSVEVFTNKLKNKKYNDTPFVYLTDYLLQLQKET